MPQKEPAGTLLDGVPLQQLAPPLEPLQKVDKEQPQPGTLNDVPVGLQPLVKQRRVDVSEIDLVVFHALQFTPEHLEAVDVDWLPAQEEVQGFFTPRRPRAVILGRGTGGTLDAVRRTLDVNPVIEVDGMTFGCVAANGGAGGVALVRQSLELEKCQPILSEAKPEIRLGNACCKVDDQGERGVSARNATTIVKLFISSRPQVLVMEAPVRFGTTEAWTTVLQPQMHMAGCEKW